MKCLNVRCQRDLTDTDILKRTDRNKYRFCRPCKGSKTVPLEISCIRCNKSVNIYYNYGVKYCSYLCMNEDRKIKKRLYYRYPTHKLLLQKLLS